MTWVFDDGTGTLTISGTGEMWDYFFTDVPWNSVCDEILDVEIGIGITSIGDYAFYNCSSLMEIEIPESVLTIGANVFVGCYDLYSIYLPASLESIGQSAFETESFYPHILYAGTEEQWNEVALDGDSVFDVDTVFHYSARGDEIEVIEICSMIGYNCSCCEGNPMWVRKDEANHRFANGICSECGVEEVWSYIIRETGEVTITDYAGNATILTIPSTIEGLPVTEIGRKAFKYCISVTEIIITE